MSVRDRARPGWEGSVLGRMIVTTQDRGSARLSRLLADPQRAARVAAIREQMDQPCPASPSPHTMTVDDLRRAADAAADAAADVNDSEVLDAAWRRR